MITGALRRRGPWPLIRIKAPAGQALDTGVTPTAEYRHMKHALLCPLLALAAALPVTQAAAQARGDWTLGVGLHRVDPKSDNGALAAGTLPVSVGASVRPTLTLEYFLRDQLGLEVIAAAPFRHDIQIAGLGQVGSTRHLPPTVSLQYHFNGGGRVSPFLGAGVNYTAFFGEEARGALQGARLQLGNSWGAALHAGLDFAVGARGAVRTDLRWMDIDTAVKLDGAALGAANIDPWVYGVSYVHRF